MPTFLSPELLLALTKITFLLLVTLVLAPFLKNPTHRARLWTATILALPIVFFTSFLTPVFEVIPLRTAKPKQPPLQQTPLHDDGQIVIEDSFGQTFRYRRMTLGPDTDLWLNNPDSETKEDVPFPYPQPGVSTEPNHEARKLYKTSSPIFHPQAVSLSQSKSIPSPSPLPAPVAPEPDITAWLIFIAIQGTLLALLPLLISSFRILRLTKSEAIDPPLALWKNIHRHSRKTPRLSFTSSPAAPFAYGIFAPRVILPDDSPTWPLRRIKSTLLHEAEHLRRRDPLVRFLSTIIRALFWFHPLAWLAHRQLIAAQEQACDQAVISDGIAPVDYAEELLGSVTHSHLTPSEALSMAKWSQLGNRVRHVLQQPKPIKMTTVILTYSLSLIVTLALTAVGFGQEPGDEARPAKTPIPPSPVDNTPKAGRGAILDRNDKPIAINDQNGKRTYPFGKALAHASGYIRKTDPDRPELPQGISGLEKAYDSILAKNTNLKVSLDAAVQEHCFDLLSKQEFPGAIVVQDPNSGEIIAMVSYPSFDPNLFIPLISQEDFGAIQANKQNPMLNRSLELFTPGSIVKPLVALAAEHRGLNNPEIHCKGFIQFDRTKIRDWKTNRNEAFRIPGALEQSCNTYFMRLAIRTGRESLTEIGNLLHLNDPPLESISSAKSNWMNFPPDFEPTDLSLAITSLGQGAIVMSPLQVNTITSAIASGFWEQPRLVSNEWKSTSLFGEGEITNESLKIIREGMHLAIHGKRGTAKNAAVPSLQLAGKTGTAQLGKTGGPTHNSWFTGYGPYEAPKYSVTVMLSGANSGGRFAAPIAAEVFKRLLTKDE